MNCIGHLVQINDKPKTALNITTDLTNALDCFIPVFGLGFMDLPRGLTSAVRSQSPIYSDGQVLVTRTVKSSCQKRDRDT
jgi:hypothetical protein